MGKEKSIWWGTGDLNAFFGLFVDNITNLVLLSAILVGGFGYPADIVVSKMIPGTALGVLVGDLAYTWMAIRLAKRTSRKDVTAMPLGLDTPSTVGIAVAVLGPVWLASKDAILTWHVGMAVLVCMGIIKVCLSFAGGWIRENFPQAGLLGSIGGVGLALLGFLPLIHIFEAPIPGMVALGILITTLVAKFDLPWKFPGALLAVVAGTILYHIQGVAGLLSGYQAPSIDFQPSLPVPSTGWITHISHALEYLPIAIPFGLLTIVGGINVTESARVAGDDYKTRDILLVEAFATLIAGVFGGVAQSTPYIGHPAYKSMGGKAGYTLLTGIFVGLGSFLGIIPVFLQILPVSAVCPILIFVGMEIIAQSYHSTPKKHVHAVTISFLPAVASLLLIYFDDFVSQFSKMIGEISSHYPDAKNILSIPASISSTHSVIRILGHGFILTAMLWGGIVSFLIDRANKKCGLLLIICSIFSLFGIIHSASPDGSIYLPWNQNYSVSIQIALIYFIMGIVALLSKKN